MKEKWVQGAPLHSHTQLHTQGLGRSCGGGQGLPSTIVFLLGLSLLIAVVRAAKYRNLVGQRVNHPVWQLIHYLSLTKAIFLLTYVTEYLMAVNE